MPHRLSRRAALHVSTIGLLCAGIPRNDFASADDPKDAPERAAEPSGTAVRLPVSEWFDGFDSYVRAAMKHWETPGLAIAVVKDGRLAFSREYGECKIGTGRKVNRETAFAIASCSKTFTAAAIALLADARKLSWDDPLVKHLPEFELCDRHLTERVTIRDMLCHRTGLQRADLLQDGTGFDAKEILRRLKQLPAIAPFRTRLIYNNHTYTVLDHLVERVAGEPFHQFVSARLFFPLKITVSRADEGRTANHNRAPRHWRSDAGLVARPYAPVDGYYATARDLANWLAFQLAEGTWANRELLKAQSVREMHALQFSAPVSLARNDNIYAAQFYGAGLGWFVQDYRGRKVVLHSGAWGAILGMIPEEKLGVVVLSNLDLESLPAMLMYDVFDACLVGPQLAWDQQKWKATWLRNEPPGHAYRAREAARAELAKSRQSETRPSLPLDRYAGRYESPLYGTLDVEQQGDELHMTFGDYTTALSHWHNESFYARTPTRLTFDWLLTFAQSTDGSVARVLVQHVGWDRTEKDHAFTRDGTPQ